MQEIAVDNLDSNPFVTRYSDDFELEGLAQSIRSQGQLEAIGVRRNPNKLGNYQVIYGHRRVAAFKKLGLKTIGADVKDVDDRTMLQMAIVENLQRKEISDYEKGLLFRNLSENFDLTYEEIGRMIGKSKQLVSNHIAMTKLFSEADIRNSSELRQYLNSITESHARVLARIVDTEERRILLKIAVRDSLCAAELRSLGGRPRIQEEQETDLEWVAENTRNRFDNSDQFRSKHGRVCILRVDSLNYLLSKLKVSPHEAGSMIAKGAAEILRLRGIDPLERKNWSKILIEKSKYAGWGKMSSTTNSKLVVHEPALNSEFLGGYLETLLGIKLKCTKSNSSVQIFDILLNPDAHREVSLTAKAK